LQKKIEIRYAETADISAVIKLFRSVVAPLEIYSQSARDGEIAKFSNEELQRRISDDPKAVALALVEDSPVGFSITDDQHGPIWVEWYGVDPNIRGSGIGRALIHSLIAEAPARNATKLWCDTRVNNTASIALFESVGFKKLCELKNHWYEQDFFLWERNV
jgi:ribosomal protein S18 acetylase RimI-like enzyme